MCVFACSCVHIHNNSIEKIVSEIYFVLYEHSSFIMTTQRYAAGLSPDVFVINMDEGKNEKNENLPYIPEPDYDNSSEEADGTSDEVS